jgi:hypothetical protein
VRHRFSAPGDSGALAAVFGARCNTPTLKAPNLSGRGLAGPEGRNGWSLAVTDAGRNRRSAQLLSGRYCIARSSDGGVSFKSEGEPVNQPHDELESKLAGLRLVPADLGAGGFMPGVGPADLGRVVATFKRRLAPQIVAACVTSVSCALVPSHQGSPFLLLAFLPPLLAVVFVLHEAAGRLRVCEHGLELSYWSARSLRWQEVQTATLDSRLIAGEQELGSLKLRTRTGRLTLDAHWLPEKQLARLFCWLAAAVATATPGPVSDVNTLAW